MTAQRKRNGQNHRAPDKPTPIAAEIAALEARALSLKRSAAVFELEAMRCIAQAEALARLRNGAVGS